jgi:hypothetical protein
MAAFATTTDMEQRSQGHITATSHPFLQKELDAASRAIRDECGWHIATAETITRKVRSASRHAIWVPAMQITTVTITTLDDVAHVLPDDQFDPETGWTSWAGDRYTLTYTAGFTAVPEDLVTLTLELAAGALGASVPSSAASIWLTTSASSACRVTVRPAPWVWVFPALPTVTSSVKSIKKVSGLKSSTAIRVN